jgi:hypothetical protein
VEVYVFKTAGPMARIDRPSFTDLGRETPGTENFCLITLAFESQTISDRKTRRSDSGWPELLHRIAAHAVAVAARFGAITRKREDWQREKPGEPLGVFLAASLSL